MSGASDTASATDRLEAIRALEHFISENDELYELEERVGKFNVFDALRVDRAEIRHSNFLAWLLDPAESHGLGELFLRALLMDLFKDAPVDRRPCSPVDLDGASLSGVEIRREWMNIDLLIKVTNPECLVLVENKIRSGEHSNQLERYKATAKVHFPNHKKILLVFLTVDGDEPSDEEWIPYTYGDLHRVLARTHRIGAGSIGDDVSVFLEHYLSLIGSRFMDDPTIDELCRKIYKNHRVALDLLFERVGSASTGVLQIAEEVLRERSDDWILLNTTSKRVTFLPRAWEGVLPPIGRRPSFDKRHWAFFRFAIANDKLFRGSRCEPTTDREMRAAVLRALCKDNRFGLKLRSDKSLDHNWIGLGREHITRLDEDEIDREAVRKLIDKKLDALHVRLAGSESVIRDASARHTSTN